jgi:hypothetical protein
LLLESKTKTSYTKNPLSGWVNAAIAEEFELVPPPTAFIAFVVASLRVVCIFDLNASNMGPNNDIVNQNMDFVAYLVSSYCLVELSHYYCYLAIS